MTFKQAMQTLKKMGTSQNVKIYKRHGAGDNLFGVSFANLKTLQKQIKKDHDLAEQLWQTGNTDAMTLATTIADPERFTASSADAWLRGISYGLLGDMFGSLIARSKLALGRWKKWSKSKKEYTRQCAYGMLSAMLRDDPEAVPDDLCREALERIEHEIHESPNLARHAMNGALISIGSYKSKFEKRALAAARRIGKVEVDHGQTSCKTPDATEYIKKTVAHYAKRGRRPKVGKC